MSVRAERSTTEPSSLDEIPARTDHLVQKPAAQDPDEIANDTRCCQSSPAHLVLLSRSARHLRRGRCEILDPIDVSHNTTVIDVDVDTDIRMRMDHVVEGRAWIGRPDLIAQKFW